MYLSMWFWGNCDSVGCYLIMPLLDGGFVSWFLLLFRFLGEGDCCVLPGRNFFWNLDCWVTGVAGEMCFYVLGDDT